MALSNWLGRLHGIELRSWKVLPFFIASSFWQKFLHRFGQIKDVEGVCILEQFHVFLWNQKFENWYRVKDLCWNFLRCKFPFPNLCAFPFKVILEKCFFWKINFGYAIQKFNKIKTFKYIFLHTMTTKCSVSS